jgi:hypothetical protein
MRCLFSKSTSQRVYSYKSKTIFPSHIHAITYSHSSPSLSIGQQANLIKASDVNLKRCKLVDRIKIISHFSNSHLTECLYLEILANSVGTSFRLLNLGVGVRLPIGTRDFPFFYSFETDYGTHPISNTMGVGSSFSWVMRNVCEAVHSTASSDEVKNSEVIPPLPHSSS